MEYDLDLSAPPMAFNYTMCAHGEFVLLACPWLMEVQTARPIGTTA